jgi:hypothetical protein
MPKRPAGEPDLDLALAALSGEDRATVYRWLDVLGMEPDDLPCVPPLQTLVLMVAAVGLAARMREAGLGREAAFREACATLDVGDMLRTWYRWQANAARHFVRDADAAA